MPERQAAIYARISQSVADVDKTENQLARLRLYAEAKGYTVVAEFEDDGISAYTGADRPAWRELLSRLPEFDYVLATENARLGRNVLESERDVVPAFRDGKTLVDTMGGGVQDLSKAMSRKYFTYGMADAEAEVAVRLERQHARLQDDLRNGIPPATRRVFGYDKDKGRSVIIRESEAQVIREGVRFLLDGGTTYALAQQWRNAGVTTTLGTDWTPETVKRTLLRPRLAGWLTHKGELISQSLPAIISQADHEALTALLTDPSRQPKRGPKVQGLLSGIMRCRCGSGVVRSNYRNSYLCTAMTSRAADKTGPHYSVRIEKAEALVEAAFLSSVADGAHAPAEGADDLKAVQAELDANTRAQDAATDLLLDPDVKDKRRAKARVVELEAARAVLEERRDTLIAKRAQGSAFDEFRAHFEDGLTEDAADDAAAYDRASMAWNALSMDRKRDIIRGAFDISLDAGWGAERVKIVQK